MATLREDFFGATEGDENIDTDTSRRRLATHFTASASYTLDRVDVSLKKVGAPTFNITMTVRSNTSNRPGTVISTSTTTLVSSSLTTGYLTYSFAGLSAAVVSGTIYWIELVTSAVGSFSNYVQWSHISGSYLGFNMTQKSADGTTWTDQANIIGQFQAFSDSGAVAGSVLTRRFPMSILQH